VFPRSERRSVFLEKSRRTNRPSHFIGFLAFCYRQVKQKEFSKHRFWCSAGGDSADLHWFFSHPPSLSHSHCHNQIAGERKQTGCALTLNRS